VQVRIALLVINNHNGFGNQCIKFWARKTAAVGRTHTSFRVIGGQASDRKGDEVSPEEAPQPARISENSCLLARVKNILEGIVSTFVGMPLRDRNWATACARTVVNVAIVG
jgi:hypothetical protein